MTKLSKVPTLYNLLMHLVTLKCLGKSSDKLQSLGCEPMSIILKSVINWGVAQESVSHVVEVVYTLYGEILIFDSFKYS